MITLYRPPRFTHPDFSYGAPNYTEYLFGAIGQKVNAEIMVQVAWGTTSVNERYTAVTNSIERLDGVSNFREDGWHVGDTFVITGTASNNTTGTITSFNDDFTIMYVSPTAPLVTETVVSTIQGTLALTSFDFYPNLIENSQAFNLFNLTDRETAPKYYTDTISTDSGNPSIMRTGTNSIGWVSPSDRATIYKSTALSTTTNQVFLISHTFTITPLFIADQLTNMQHRLAPAAGSFKDRFALKYIFMLDGKFSTLDPNIPHTTEGNVEFSKGQTGWYNEFVNGRPSVWVKESILYFDNATGEGLTAIDYCKTVDVEAILQGQDGVAETKFIVSVFYMPLNEDRYVNTLTDYQVNFIYERAVITLGAGTQQGENIGDYHFLKNVTMTVLSASRVQFDFQIDYSAVVTELLDSFGADNLNYCIFITAGKNL